VWWHVSQLSISAGSVDQQKSRFLHASLQLNALSRCISLYEVQQALEGFPSTIQELYLQTWSRICHQTPEHVSIAKAVLLWVVYAARAMTVEELQSAVATSPTYKFEANRLVPEATLISLCCGLVTLEEESRRVRLVRELLDSASCALH
jgi:ankyrin repeat domain-containing protein 50